MERGYYPYIAGKDHRIVRSFTGNNIMDLSEELYRVDFQPIGKRVTVKKDTLLLEAAQKAGVSLSSTCGGLGKCGRCRVMIMHGNASDATDQELAVLSQKAVDSGERLACLTSIQGDMKVNIPPKSLISYQRLQLKGINKSFGPISPLVKCYAIELSKPTLDDPRSDFERVTKHLQSLGVVEEPKAEAAVVRQLPERLRKSDWKVNVYLRGNELVGVAPHLAVPLGIAIDLGTTKIAATLFDLQNGQQLAVCGAMNPQIAYGEDLIARLMYAHQRNDNSKVLATIVQETLQTLIENLLSETDLNLFQVVDICIAGNTAMTHLLLEYPVSQLAQSPYVAASSSPINIKAKDLGLSVAPGANVHILGSIGGFVGGDHVAMILACQLYQCNDIVLGIDIGTNSEIVLYKPQDQSITTISCASGPAFEGGHIGDGMRAGTGAIESVKIIDNRIVLKTIDDAPPSGICGSGIIDAVSELLRNGIINASGRLNQTNPLVRPGSTGPEVLIVAGAESGTGQDITITQKDISEIQLAKGAIRAGMDTLLSATNTRVEDVKEVIVAGAFGSFLDLKQVLDIGMFPRFPSAQLEQVGNAALEGVKQALLSEEERSKAKKISERSDHIESSRVPDYSRFFATGIQFPTRPL